MRVSGRPSTVLTRSLYLLVLFSAWPAVVRAQDSAPPAHIAFAEGSASLDREGQAQPATAGVPFLAGDRLRTTGGRIEVLFPDGSALEIDEYSSVDLLSATLLRVTGGRIMLIVSGAEDQASALRYQVDTPVASASTDGPGEYRVALLSGPAGLEAELAVVRGLASLRTERGSTPVRAGERSLARDLEAPSFPQVFNSARFDAFDRWAALRRDARMGTAQSAQYLPRELQMYGGTFDRYGAWQQEPQYGYVWYPAASPDWRPYYNGYWSANGPYGWTWIGLDVWGWPTHHYGRWGFSRSRWFWIPERRWAPSWVTWAAAPGYVSWCPLGFDNRPVFALSVNAGNPWLGWVVVPRTHFGAPGAYVHRYAVPHLPAAAPVVLQAAAPVLPRAVPRTTGAAPLTADVAVPRVPGRDIAVPRGSGSAAYGRPPSAPGTAPSAGGNQPLAARREGGVRVPGSGASQDLTAGQAGRTTHGFDQAVGRSPAAAIKVPLAEVPRAYQRDPGGTIPRDPSGDTNSRAGERSPSRLASPWYGHQPTPWYGGAGRAAQPVTPTDPAAASSTDGQRRAYPRDPVGAPAAPHQMPIAPAPQGAVPRWGAPTVVQRAQPIYAPPAAAQPPAPASPELRAPAMRAPAASAPAAVERGSVPGSPPSAAPAAAPAREAAPRHAPASRRPS